MCAICRAATRTLQRCAISACRTPLLGSYVSDLLLRSGLQIFDLSQSEDGYGEQHAFKTFPFRCKEPKLTSFTHPVCLFCTQHFVLSSFRFV